MHIPDDCALRVDTQHADAAEQHLVVRQLRLEAIQARVAHCAQHDARLGAAAGNAEHHPPAALKGCDGRAIRCGNAAVRLNS